MRIKNHKIVEINYKRSPNQSGVIIPRYLMVHYTAGRSYEASLNTLSRPSSKVSAHILIGRAGEVVQLVPFNRKAWHAGTSQWKDLVGLNEYSIGIELDNYGKLTRMSDGTWKTYFGRAVDPSEVMIARHKNGGSLAGWHMYTEAQLDVLDEIGETLFDYYDLEDVLGHDDVAPKRKTDPGPAFNMNSFRAKMLGRENDHIEYMSDPEIDMPDFIFYNPVSFLGK